MSETPDQVYDSNPPNDNDAVVDQDVVFGGDDGGDDALDRSWSPPEKPRELDAFGTTVAEQRQGETLDQRLAQEEPDPNMDVDLVAGEPPVRAGEGGAVPDDIDTGYGEVPDEEFSDVDFIDDGEVGDERAGRLVDPDGGLGIDTEKDLIGEDVGIDGGAASAEEAAMHIVRDGDRW
jgi:hypothetical protein